jgi:hypothetical protein
VKHVLYYFDGPKMVLALDAHGRQLLGVAADEDEAGIVRWVFAPAAAERVIVLLKTRMGLRAFFESGSIEIHDIGTSWTSVRAWLVAPDDVPADLLPEVDAELPELADHVREDLLAEQCRLVEQRSRVARAKLLFEGRPVRGRRGISVTFAGEALSGYQAIISLAYGHRRKGGLRSTGPIPEREGSTLMLTDMPRGSVGFELVEDVEQERVVPTDLSEIVSEVGVLFDAAASSDSAYAESVAEFDQRIVAALNDFLGKLRKAEATMKLEVQGKEYVFDAARINEAVERTASAPKEEDDRPVAGTLIGFLPTDRRFELETPDRVIKGKIARDADAGAVAAYFQKACTAHLHVVTVERLGQTAQAFTLIKVEPPKR